MLSGYRWYGFVIMGAYVTLGLAGCSDISSQEPHQAINAGKATGASYYQQQGQDLGATLSNELGAAFGDMH